MRRHIRSSVTYSFCGTGEIVEHALLICPWTSPVWLVILELGITTIGLSTLDRCLENFLCVDEYTCGIRRELLRMVAFTLWNIWKERSTIIFQDSGPCSFRVISRVQSAVGEFISTSNGLQKRDRGRSEQEG